MGFPQTNSIENFRSARSQFVRTVCEIPIECDAVAPSEQPCYRKIADKVQQLKELGLNQRTIVTQLKVDYKTISKAIQWLSLFDSWPLLHSTRKCSYFNFLIWAEHEANTKDIGGTDHIGLTDQKA